MNPRMCVERERHRPYVMLDIASGKWFNSDDPELGLHFSESPDEFVVWTRQSMTTSLGPRG